MRRPGVALALQSIAAGGRDAFYGGAFGEGLLALGDGYFDADDLAESQAGWVEPLRASAFGVEVSTIPPNSQGYLTLGALRLLDHLGVPDDPDDPRWAHLLVEAAATAGFDRPDVLHEHADGDALVAAIEARADLVDPERAGGRPAATADGDTTYLCTADATGLAVSLIQSNASGFGSWLVEPTTGINLHNRGLGFSLRPGHPAEHRSGARPPHTLCPAMATRDGELAAVFGTMGGDAQPQILLQVAARLFAHGDSPADAVGVGPLDPAGSGDRVRHLDERRAADGARRRARPGGLAGRSHRPGPCRRRRGAVRLGVRPRPRHRRRSGRRARRRGRPAGSRRQRGRDLIRCPKATPSTASLARSTPSSPGCRST